MKRSVIKRVFRCLTAAAVVFALALTWSPAASAAKPGEPGYTWVWQNPLPRSHNMFAAAASGAGRVWSVGEYGCITYFNGSVLSEQKSNTTANLYGAHAVDASNVWAVGEGGAIIRTTNGGGTWVRETPPSTGYSYDLWSVTATSNNNVYAVGGHDGFTDALVLHRDAGGWHVEMHYAEGGFTDVFALNASAVWVVGQAPPPAAGRTLFYNGSTWALRDTTRAPMCISAYDANNLWAVDWDGTVLRSANGGASYSAALSGQDWPASVAALDATHVWVAGWEGKVHFSSNNGSSWAAQTSPTTGDLCDIYAVNATNIYCVGYEAFMTSSGGSAWTLRTGGSQSTQYAACGLDASRVWSFGANDANLGNLLNSTDGGSVWSAQSSGQTTTLISATAADASNMWALGDNGYILRYNGSSWSRQYSYWSIWGNRLKGISAANASNAWAVGTGGTILKYNGRNWSTQLSWTITALNAVSALDSNNVWAVGAGGAVRRTTTGGLFWSGEANLDTDLYAVHALDDRHVWAVGAGGNIYFYNGSSWARQTSGGATLRGVWAADASHVWAVGDSGTIRFFDGSSWTQQAAGMTTNALYGVYASDASNAWAVGAGGTILYADPPFIRMCAPGYGDPGDTVPIEIIGGYTAFDQDESEIDLGAGITMVDGTLNVIDSTHLYAEVSVDPGAALGPRRVNVTTGDETPVPLEGGFVVGAEPSIASVTPATAARGWRGEVEIAGSLTSFSASSRASLGADVTVNSLRRIDPQLIRVNVTVSQTASPGVRSVNVVTGKEKPRPLTGVFRVVAPPVLNSLSRNSGPPGEKVTLYGAGFGPMRGTGGGNRVSQVEFEGVPAAVYRQWSDRKIVCEVPAGARKGPVVVRTPDGVSGRARSFTPTEPVSMLAEGSTAWGFDTEIAVMNPNDDKVTVRPTLLTGEGQLACKDLVMEARTTRVIDPRAEYGFNGDFSTRVECLDGESITADRTMSWNGGGTAGIEGHSSSGVASPSVSWYLPEGSTAWGFETWLLLQNPNDSTATCRVTYMIEGRGPHVETKSLPADSRATVNMAEDIGAADASIMVQSDLPVVAERSMYRSGSPAGHNSTGANAPSKEWFLGEGSTAWGFETWLLLQNPGPDPARVSVTYMTPNGPIPDAPFEVPASSRKTVRVNDVVPGKDLSIKVSGSEEIVAERAMYWDSGSGGAGHDSIGADAPHRMFYLPGGRCGDASGTLYETWTLIQNPGDTDVEVRVTYMAERPERNCAFTEVVPANARRTYRMSEAFTGRAGVEVECLTPGHGVIAERATYWSPVPGARGAGVCAAGASAD